MSQTLSLPSAGRVIPAYEAVSQPVAGSIPDKVKPIGLGQAVAGGSQLTLKVSLPEFSGPVDVYLGIQMSSDLDTIYLMKSDKSYQPVSSGWVKWQGRLNSPLNETVFDIPLSSLPPATYTVYLMVTPAGTRNSYYVWSTHVSSVPSSSCCSSVASEGPALGNYRALSHQTGISISSVALAKRGWRAVAGSQDSNIYFFERSKAAPVLTYPTGGQVTSVDISSSGCSFAAGSKDGIVYFFECNSQTPTWTYDTSSDAGNSVSTVNDVVVTPDGRWIAAVSRTHVYLFSRLDPSPVLKKDLSLQTNGAFLTTVDLADNAAFLVVGTDRGSSGGRVFYLDQKGIKWTYNVTDLGWGSHGDPCPVAISANGRKIAAGGGDNMIKFWDSSSATPLWSYKIAEESPVYSVDLDQTGSSLVATGDFKLFYFNNTSKGAPAFTYDGSYQTGTNFPMPEVYPGNKNVAGNYDIGNYLNAVAITADGSYFAAGDYVYGHAFGFYREFDKPFRMYDLDNDSDSVNTVDISSDGSWIMLGSTSGEILRFEVAPAEIIEIPVPLSIRISNQLLNTLIGGGEVDVNYTIIKPGRAAELEQDWEVWAYQGGIVIPPNKFVCQGDMSWKFQHSLADGDVIKKGKHTVTMPQCLDSSISSYGAFVLHSELFGAGSELYDDTAYIADIQVGGGGN